MDEKITRIRDKIIDKGVKMNPVLSLQEVDDFEMNNNIHLPSEFREFITQIGNGGDGPPHYKIYQLERSFCETRVFNKGYDNFLELEFPLTKYWVWESEKVGLKRKGKFVGVFIMESFS